MITYELAKQLKEAGYLRTGERNGKMIDKHGDESFPFPIPEKVAIDLEYVYIPTLSELIEACGDKFDFLANNRNGTWQASGGNVKDCKGNSPEDAVSNLWLELNKK